MGIFCRVYISFGSWYVSQLLITHLNFLSLSQEILQADYRILLQKYGIDLDKIDAQEEESLFGLDFPDMSVQEDITEWL